MTTPNQRPASDPGTTQGSKIPGRDAGVGAQPSTPIEAPGRRGLENERDTKKVYGPGGAPIEDGGNTKPASETDESAATTNVDETGQSQRPANGGRDTTPL